ncbi:hypothetical protein, partial [Actinokineospora sp.]|uniref:hypothetical protein n=1 Tax=Actinokineospora sp. TaxID=1872133 RepID=UPI003D6B6B1A
MAVRNSVKCEVEASDRSFGSEHLSDGQNFEHTFDKPGTDDHLLAPYQVRQRRTAISTQTRCPAADHSVPRPGT